MLPREDIYFDYIRNQTVITHGNREHKAKMAFFSLLLLSLTVNSAFSARIAAFCSVGKSQYLNLKNVLEELASRGHEVG